MAGLITSYDLASHIHNLLNFKNIVSVDFELQSLLGLDLTAKGNVASLNKVVISSFIMVKDTKNRFYFFTLGC